MMDWCKSYSDLEQERDDLKRRLEVVEFWMNVDKTDTCWLWTRSCTAFGHGQVYFNGRHYVAHRLAWELVCGPIPKGMILRHKCDVPRCVNPAHLELGTHKENSTRKLIEQIKV